MSRRRDGRPGRRPAPVARRRAAAAHRRGHLPDPDARSVPGCAAARGGNRRRGPARGGRTRGGSVAGRQARRRRLRPALRTRAVDPRRDPVPPRRDLGTAARCHAAGILSAACEPGVPGRAVRLRRPVPHRDDPRHGARLGAARSGGGGHRAGRSARPGSSGAGALRPRRGVASLRPAVRHARCRRDRGWRDRSRLADPAAAHPLTSLDVAGDRRGSVASPARLGLTDPAATDVLTQLGWWRDGSPVAEVTGVLWALSRSPAPDLALRALQRLADAMGGGWAELDGAVRRDAGLRGRLLGVLGGSVALGDHLVADPGRWRRLTRGAGGIGGRGWTRRMRDALLMTVGADPQQPPPGIPGGAPARLSGTPAQRALRAGYLDLILDVAAADLAAVVEPGLPVLAFEDVGTALAELAAAALAAALAVAVTEVCGDGPLEAHLAVIGMGKCGGSELNSVSDVDVVFVAESEDELA